MKRRKCAICGIVKKITFNCSRCDSRICLNCFNFVHNLCFDCETIDYNERYKEKIERYKAVI